MHWKESLVIQNIQNNNSLREGRNLNKNSVVENAEHNKKNEIAPLMEKNGANVIN